MDRKLALDLLKATEAGAIESAKWIGKQNSDAADAAAVKGMRTAFNLTAIDGTIIIGEGERDEAPMLYIGEKVGTGKGPAIDIAVDPLEGTGLTARGEPNSLSVLAAAPAGNLLHAPDTYMDKIAVGPEVGNAISLDNSIAENLSIVSAKLGKPISDVTAIILDRPRHKDIIDTVKITGAKVHLIGDGDVAAAISTLWKNRGIDILIGVGGAPEGVLAAAALKCNGGYMEGRLKFRNEKERKRAVAYGMKNPDAVLTIDQLAKGDDLIFAATGVTEGDLLKGVSLGATTKTYSILMNSKGKKLEFIESVHRVTK